MPTIDFPSDAKGIDPEADKLPKFPAQVVHILEAASASGKITHNEARLLLAEVKDVVLQENGLTRQQLDYELYLRTMQGD